jgi:phage terminase large subunit-like protein
VGEPKGNANLVTNQVSGPAKIDPLMAAFNAIALMATNFGNRFSDPQMFFV